MTKKHTLREKKLKKISYDKYTKSDIKFLWLQGIINGVGAEWMWAWFRRLLTWLLPFLEWERHDVAFWKGGNKKAFHKANWGILKYSFVSIASDYRKLHFCYKWAKIWRVPYFYTTVIFKAPLILIAYSLCEGKGGIKAFDFRK